MTRLAEAYRVIEDRIESAVGDDTDELADFAQWILEHVFVVDLLDTSPFDDQTLFDRINTRGYPLTGADVFRSRVTMSVRPWQKPIFLQAWKDARTKAALAYGRSPTSASLESERQAITAWLIGRYAGGQDVKDKARLILKEPYEWAHENLPVILTDEKVPDAFRKDFFPLVEALEEPIDAQRNFNRELAGFYSANLVKFPLAEALAAAVLKPSRKSAWKHDMRIVSRFLDTLAMRCAWGSDWCQTQGQKFDLMCEAITIASHNTGDTLSGLLRGLLTGSPNFAPRDAPSLSKSNKTWVRHFLCRITDHFELTVRGRDELASLFGPAAKPEIEHIMANYPDFQEHFTPSNWKAQRERLGALVILPKRVNAALSDASYTRKLEEYAAHNALAASLSPRAYDGHLRLRGSRRRQPFSFSPHAIMTPGVISERELLYCAIADDLWPRKLLPEQLQAA